MTKLIISYRRSDSQAIAGRIRDRLVGHYGDEGSVYMDIDSIPAGRDFRAHIDKAMMGGDILIAIVGPKWLGPGRAKRFRIDDPADLVRVEVETALRRGLEIVPVLVDGASMPTAAALPDSLKDFAYRNAAVVDPGQDFHLHMDRLIRSLDQLKPQPVLATLFTWRKLMLPMTGGAVSAVAAAAIFFVFQSPQPQQPSLASVQQEKPILGIGGPWAPPSPRKYWDADRSLVYLEPTGLARELIFVEPTPDLTEFGVQPGDLLFEGRRTGDAYEGVAYLYAGTCGRFGYSVRGPVIEDTTVELIGQAPRIDRTVCKQAREVNDEFIFDTKKIVVKYKYEK